MTSENGETPRIRLRPFSKEHLEATYEWLQDQDLRQDFLLLRPITREGHAKWFQRLARDETQAVFAIEDRDLGHVGNAGVKNLEGPKGELWIYLRPGKVRGHGLGLLATQELIRILFEDMDLEEIYLHVAQVNHAALGLYEKLGFVRSRKAPSAEWDQSKNRVVRMRLARPKDKDRPKILLACYDSGGANALAVLARELDQSGYRVLSLAAGPSRSVFRNLGIRVWREMGRDIRAREADRILEEVGCGLVILGTSLNAWTERNFCGSANRKKIPTISFVDFWSNYARRFSNPGTLDLAYVPDKVAVLDRFCLVSCVAQGVPRDRLVITGNPYWDHLRSLSQGEKQAVRKAARARFGLDPDDRVVLIISSNLRNLEFDLGYTDLDLFEAVFPLPDRCSGPGRVRFVIKPHPEESRAELMDLVKGRGLVLEPETPPLEAVLGSDLVIGSVSSLVFEAALLGRRVISLQPVGLSKRKQVLRLFQRLGIPEIGTPEEAEKHIRDFIESAELIAPKPVPDMESCSGRAVEEFRKTIRELEAKQGPGKAGAEISAV